MRLLLILLFITPSIVLAQKDSTKTKKQHHNHVAAFSHAGVNFNKSFYTYFEYSANSTAITNSFLKAMGNGFIENEQKDDVSAKIKKSNRLGYDLQFGATYKVKKQGAFLGIDKPFLTFGYKYRDHLNAKFNDNFFEMAFRGNKPFAGETVKMDNVKFNWVSYQGLYFGLEKVNRSYSWGTSIGLLKGSNFASGDAKALSIYTATTGEYIDFNMDGSLTYTKAADNPFFAVRGWGLSASFFFEKNINKDKLRVGVQDFGFLNFANANSFTASSENTFEGVEIDNIFNFSSTTGSLTDSINAQLGIEDKKESKLYFIPAIIRINYQHVFSDMFKMDYGMKYYITAHNIPRFYVRPIIGKYKVIQGTATIAYGGFGYTDIGVGLQKRLEIEKHDGRILRYQMAVNAYFLERVFVPTTSSGQAVSISFSSYF